MRLAVLDATAVGGGPVTRALECAAREVGLPRANVVWVRLYRLFTSCCSACGRCAATGRCSARCEAIDEVSGLLLDADLLLVGVLSGAWQRDMRAEALLRRLVGAFGHVYDTRYGECPVHEAGLHKAAGLVCTAPPLLGAAAALGMLPYGLKRVWRVLDRAGVEVVGAASVTRHWEGPASWDVARQRAARLGRALGSSVTRAPMPVAPTAAPAEPEPVPSAAHTTVRVA